jgi:alkaline phosphatase D
MTRREALQKAALLGAALAWPAAFRDRRDNRRWREARELYPQGVASGDPHADSVLLWTRHPAPQGTKPQQLEVEVAEDPDFAHVVATARTTVSAETDWTCRVLAAGLQPSREYWYRFGDASGRASRIGRTRTASAAHDPRPIRFAFVSCQNVTQGACNTYRRMLFDDERRAADDRIEFVLHLGDFVYEVVWYPEDRPRGVYDRRLRDIVRYPAGEKIADFHVPTTVEDYRTLYRAYLSDPDLQDARARWPFVCVWDNHEFSWKGWQTQQEFGSGARPAQTRKVAANQVWFEYQPARVAQRHRVSTDRFVPPIVEDAPITRFDEEGLGQENNNLSAIESLTVYRTSRWGRNVELFITDNRSFRSQPVTQHSDFAPFRASGFPFFLSQDVVEILDAGRTYDEGKPPDTIRFGNGDLPNPRKHSPAQSMLGRRQKAWLKDRLQASTAPWKLWGNSVAGLNWRTDLQNLPPEFPRWPASGYAQLGDDDWSGYYTERNEILDFVHSRSIFGFVSIAGDRHAFMSGLLSVSLPPKPFTPVAAEFVVGSVSAPGLAEAAKYVVTRDHPVRALYVHESRRDASVVSALNVSIRHGVRASLTLDETGSEAAALGASNPDVSPHLSFVDAGGHGYASVRADEHAIDVEFVCIPAPLERSDTDDGGPIVYRLVQHLDRWTAEKPPAIKRLRVEGLLPVTSGP